MRLIVCSLSFSLFCLLGSAVAAPRNALVLVNASKVSAATDGFDGAVGKQIIAGLAAGGLTLSRVDDGPATARLAACHELACSAAAAKSVQAAYAIQLSVEMSRPEPGHKGTDRRVSLLAVSAGDPAQRWFEKSQCADCDLDEAKQMAYLLAVEVGRQIVTYESDLAKQVAAAPPVAKTPSAATPMIATTPPVVVVETPPATPHHAMRWWVPWTFGAGVATLGTGIVLVAIGQQSGCPNASYSDCKKTRDLGPPGYVVGGIGLAVIGAAALGYFLPANHDSSTSVAFGPTGFSIVRRF